MLFLLDSLIFEKQIVSIDNLAQTIKELLEVVQKDMLAKSKAGHDAGNIYIIVETDAQYVYLVDGKIRTLDKPKRKKRKHVQPILKRYTSVPISPPTNSPTSAWEIPLR